MCSGRSRLFGVKVYMFLIAVSVDLAGKAYTNQRHFVHETALLVFKGSLPVLTFIPECERLPARVADEMNSGSCPGIPL